MNTKITTTKKVSLAYSPCPNDSYVLGAIASRDVAIPGIEFDITLLDIDALNSAALEQRYDIIKVSCHAYLQIMKNYRLLDTGAAMGYGNGPLLLSSQSRSLDELQDCSVVFPGKETTACLLFQLIGVETAEHHFIPYNEIIPRVKSGEFDCGVIIHEGRFTYKESGLHLICDLGEWWEIETGLPVPLGCFVIRKSIDNEFASKFESLMRRSFCERNIDDAGSDQYIINNSQEIDPAVLKSHIELYVNSFTKSLGVTGHQAINVLAERASLQGLIS
jgi:1,4-dihydroxy-6-naphthoate synthase